MRPLHVHIERLVLDMPGAGQRSGEAVRRAIEDALSEMADERVARATVGTTAEAAAGREAGIAIRRAVGR